MTKHKTLFLTQRGLQHQQWAMEAAPPELDLIMRRGTDREELLALLADAEFLISERTGMIDAEMIAAAPKLRLIQRLGRQTWDIDLDAARARAREVAREGTGNRALLPFAMPPAPERKTKEQVAIENAWKPDCKDAYKGLGLLAVVPLLANEIGEGTCRW